MDVSRLLDREYWLIRSITQRGTGLETVVARVDERVGWPPRSISFRAAGAPAGTAGAEWLALNNWH